MRNKDVNNRKGVLSMILLSLLTFGENCYTYKKDYQILNLNETCDMSEINYEH